MKHAPHMRGIVAAVIGNALEWYDFVVFSYMTVVLADLFFPTGHSYTSILLTTGTFGVAFLMRPIGGLVLGSYADRFGRKRALSLVIALMTLGLLIISLAPTHASIGVAAPVLIVIARLIQGFSAGGEFGTATALLIESAPPGRSGFFGSFQMASQAAALLLGAIVGALVTKGLSHDELMAWGWRIPFVIGLVIGPVGFYIRRNLVEPESAPAADERPTQVLQSVVRDHIGGVLSSLAAVVALTSSVYVLVSYLPTYAVKQLKLPIEASFYALVAGNTLLVLLCPVAGRISDSIGRKSLSLVSLVVTLALLYPLFAWLNASPSVAKILLVQCLLSVSLAGFYGPFGALVSEQFPAEVRSTGLSLAYNLAVMLFGGFSQMIVTWLIDATGSALAPTFYAMFCVGMAVVGVATMAAGRVSLTVGAPGALR
ncbi:sugar (and other) transporter family protein [Burkholderia thailandensis MSMB121]|uniref:MFS transporter n=3 Tax=Burkholderia humptydooensis TaxID=430531 RepID=A0A7U4P721_9BURK|nr:MULTISPECIES: MFS transporter [Burkholderia]AGK49318.1 sugar (and other) transporter family protein [Burkholderia thailandensis MSMB121]AJY42740.1 sugar (and other) transporter family protein [Burkholderia sp. 2002721687]ALX44137.1 MFS transporter [Burkholderia humptydooensis]KST75833.1 MFS transporter [Burkholderia humptydooensis]QPS43917.1 MFS transporter [Burkholderia humptydooensis]